MYYQGIVVCIYNFSTHETEVGGSFLWAVKKALGDSSQPAPFQCATASRQPQLFVPTSFLDSVLFHNCAGLTIAEELLLCSMPMPLRIFIAAVTEPPTDMQAGREQS